MTELLAGVCAVTVTLVLVAAFAGHLRRPDELPRALRAHRTVPGPLVRPLAHAVAATEGMLGVAAGLGVLSGSAAALRAATGSAAGLFTIYLLYGWHVLHARARSSPVPCGCGGGGRTPLSGWTVLRAAVLAGLAAIATAGAGTAGILAGPRLAIAVTAGACFAVLLWQLPAAMYDPEAARGVDATAVPSGPGGSATR